ncbi:hypothetical protein [Acidovorax sp. SUPP2539]|uniref:hypothetical protein n=1 Tax=Acidovorax sp. SUPP2539 TaxID=2920878 RepID=UPI0023DE2A49|nr:hypothetical protein [Acidovorax sp. SUPP2539]GKS88271.1 hypothetical protein AVTE2539_02920 [Acidovorax sp. SUPP2539]
MSTQDDEDPIQRARRLRSAAVALRQSLHQAAERLHLARTALAEQRRSLDPGRTAYAGRPAPCRTIPPEESADRDFRAPS